MKLSMNVQLVFNKSMSFVEKCEVSYEISKAVSYDEGPERMPHPHVRLQVEELDPPGLVVPVKDNRGATGVVVALDDNGQERAKHADGLGTEKSNRILILP